MPMKTTSQIARMVRQRILHDAYVRRIPLNPKSWNNLSATNYSIESLYAYSIRVMQATCECYTYKLIVVNRRFLGRYASIFTRRESSEKQVVGIFKIRSAEQAECEERTIKM